MHTLSAIAFLILFLVILWGLIAWAVRQKPVRDGEDEAGDWDSCWSEWDFAAELDAEREYLAGRMGRTPDGLRGEG